MSMTCEHCRKDQEGLYGSGRFCNAFCARAYSSNLKREEVNKKVSQKLKGHKPTKGLTGLRHSEESKRKISETVRSKLPKLTDEEVSEKKRRQRRKNVEGVMAYRSRKYAATPPDADRKLIQMIYESCPEGYHVDHIQALARGGLHHQDNLQYLPISENCRKCADRSYDMSSAVDWRSVLGKKHSESSRLQSDRLLENREDDIN